MQYLDAGTIADVLTSLRTATEHATSWAKAWHQWALFNVAVMQVSGREISGKGFGLLAWVWW